MACEVPVIATGGRFAGSGGARRGMGTVELGREESGSYAIEILSRAIVGANGHTRDSMPSKILRE